MENQNFDYKLFTELKKYRPREGKDSTENFITTAFYWILRNNNPFATCFLSKIADRLFDKIQTNILSETLGGEWNIQHYFGGVYPDMTYTCSTNKILVFEHKVWSSNLHGNQLDNYRNYAKNNYDDNHIILITAHAGQHNQDFDVAICWSNVFEWIDEWQKENGEEYFLKAFQELLKNEGLGPVAPISHQAIVNYFGVRGFENNLLQMVQRTYDLGIIQKIIPNNEIPLGYKNHNSWGRLGISTWENINDWYANWYPSIFIGFILDPKGHRTKPIIEHSPDFTITLCVHVKLHDKYPKNEHYKALVTEIETKLSKDKTLGSRFEWDFYHQIADKTLVEYNRWHPFHIRIPMLELFRGTTTANEQQEALKEAIETVLPILWGSQNFQNMRNDLKQYM